MRPGVRAVGVAESTPPDADHSVLGGAVVRADRVVDGATLGTCTVGGTDATAAVGDLVAGLERPDARHVLVAGVAVAWYNVIDIGVLHDRLERPVISVSFEDSSGLETAIREGVPDPEPRLRTYRRLPERHPVELGDGRHRVFVRAAGCPPDRAAAVVRAHTPEGGRPEPVRVAREVARAGTALLATRPADDPGGDAGPMGKG